MKLLNLFVLIGFVAVLIVGLTPYIQAKIVSSGTAVQTSSSPGSGTVTSISQGTGLSFSVNPLITTGTISLAEALTGTIGGVKVLNCSSGYFMAQTNATGQLSCVGEKNNGTVTSITASTGLSGGIITTTGTIALNEAEDDTLGGIILTNCTAGNYFDGFVGLVTPRCTAEVGDISSVTAGVGLSGGGASGAVTLDANHAGNGILGVVSAANCSSTDKYSSVQAGGVLTCSADSTGGSTDYQVMWNGRTWGTLRPLGTTATTFTAVNWAAFVANGTPVSHALADNFYIRYTNTSSAGLTANGSAGITQTAIQTQFRYRPIIKTSVMTNSTNANIKYWFGISDQLFPFYYSARGTALSASITFNTNSSHTNWMCCTNDGTAGGSTCTSTGISMTTNSPYNLTLNLSNYPTDVRCLVQNNTASATITKTSNIPADTGVNLAVANVAQSQTTANVVYSIRGMYFESK